MISWDEPWVCQALDGTLMRAAPLPAAILAGSFNPLHDGHRSLADAASRKLGIPVVFELSILNADKPELDHLEVQRRTSQFLGFSPVFITRAATFVEKAALFPGSVLVLGADTAERVVDPRFYGQSPPSRDRALLAIRRLGCRFLVGGRLDTEGKFLNLGGITIPEGFQDLFLGLTEIEFRIDISSTLLRTKLLRSSPTN